MLDCPGVEARGEALLRRWEWEAASVGEAASTEGRGSVGGEEAASVVGRGSVGRRGIFGRRGGQLRCEGLAAPAVASKKSRFFFTEIKKNQKGNFV